MPITPSRALLAALALAAAPAFAQETTAPATPAAPAPAADAPATPAADAPAADAPAAPAADAPAADAPAPAAGTPAAAPATGEPQAGQYYVKATNNDWTTRCLKAEQGKDPCELYQLMKDAEGNSVAEMTLIPLKNSKDVAAGATLIAPLETDLIQGLGLAVGNAEPRGYPFSFCAPVGCVSRLGFTQAELDELKRGSQATVSLLPFGGDREKPVQLKLSLSGFTAAFDALSAYADEPVPAAEAAPAPDAPAEEAPAN
ncbi:invasion associated locus B family protein [Paracoccus benzoatiresistens]|uniref:Invasion associated locus B family protein n=1 Tax=Paracoccus benzoatiresistens TaxID=2997341 RepID=A0ABT4J3M0_9RHOB|nr:invasion associated locus B family protein [Paracoccus sp. EF6]MCZ0961729.1 invasion associated locus B family protein [Paracoccus sp. EF6]